MYSLIIIQKTIPFATESRMLLYPANQHVNESLAKIMSLSYMCVMLSHSLGSGANPGGHLYRMCVPALDLTGKGEKNSCCYGMGQGELFCPSLWAIIKVLKSLPMWSLRVVTYSGCSWKHAPMACILALLLEPPRAIRTSYRSVMTGAIIECLPSALRLFPT